MNETERYLNAAIRGLWGRQRRALKAELRGHITVRVQEFRLGGLSAAEAERQTLRELGAPVRVSGGMLGVHALPALGRAGALSALLMTGLLTVLPQGLAQVSGKFLAPDDALASSYLDFNQLKFEIAKVGGTLTGTAENPTISLPGLSIPTMLSGVAAWRGAALTQGGRQYIQGSAVLTRLRSTGAEVRLSGWNPVQIHVGNFVLTVETRGDRRVASDLYIESIGELFSDRVSSGRAIPRRTSFDNRGDRTNPNGLTFSGPVKVGEIYALVVPIFSTWWTEEGGIRKEGGEIMFTVDSNSATNGSVLLRKYDVDAPYKLYSSVAAFQTALEPYRVHPNIVGWDTKHPAPALLVKLNGTFGKDAFTVVPPASVTISP